MIAVEQYTNILATFMPKRTDDLKPGVEKFIGGTFEFQAGWRIDEGSYKGQFAMIPPIEWGEDRFWVPQVDLEIPAPSKKRMDQDMERRNRRILARAMDLSLSLEEIAAEFDMTKQNVSLVLHKLGHRRDKRRPQKARRPRRAQITTWTDPAHLNE